MNRRFIITAAAMLPIGYVVSGMSSCGGGVATQVPLYVAAIEAVGQQALLALPQLIGAGLSGTAASSATTIINQISNVGKAISAAATATESQNSLIQIEGYINALAPIVASFASVIPGGAIIGLIVAALPAIEFAVNLGVTLLSPQAQQLAATAPPVAAAPTGRMGDALPTAASRSQAYLNQLIATAH